MRDLYTVHPAAAAAYFAAAAGVAMFRMDPVIGAMSLAGAVALCVLVKGLGTLRQQGWMLALFVALALLNPLTHHDGITVLLVVNDRPITLEACLYGLTAAGLLVAMVYWFRAFHQVMTSDRLLVLLGGLSPGLALVVSMALRYVPLYGRQMKKVQQTQRALGLYREDNWLDQCRGSLGVFSVMATWALENGVITADSMAARGYGLRRRSHFRKVRFSWQDGVLAGLSLVLAAIALWGSRTVAFYPRLVFAPMTLRSFAGYGAYGALMALPHLMQAKEAIRWRWFR